MLSKSPKKRLAWTGYARIPSLEQRSRISPLHDPDVNVAIHPQPTVPAPPRKLTAVPILFGVRQSA